MIERDYKYKELCALMGEEPKTGKSKQLQLKRWKCFFEWENPTTQIYRITKVYEVPLDLEDGRKNNGGSRAGAGAKVKVEEEFDVLFHRFILDESRKNTHYYNADYSIYFNNDNINKYFGVYRDIYEARKTDKDGNLIDDKVNLIVYDKIVDKLREKSRSWILDKMAKVEDIELTYGVIAHCGSYYNFRDDLTETYDIVQRKFLDENGFRTPVDIVRAGMWKDMEDFICNEIKEGLKVNGVLNDDFKRYKKIKKYHKIIFKPECERHEDKYLDYSNIKKMRRSFNQKIIKEVYNFFLKKEKECHADIFGDEFDEDKAMEDYAYILNKYVKID